MNHGLHPLDGSTHHLHPLTLVPGILHLGHGDEGLLLIHHDLVFKLAVSLEQLSTELVKDQFQLREATLCLPWWRLFCVTISCYSSHQMQIVTLGLVLTERDNLMGLW